MKIKSIKKVPESAKNVVVLADKKSDIKHLPCEKVIPFMKEGFDKEDVQSIKTTKHKMYVVKTKGADLEKIRQFAHKIHTDLKDKEEEIVVVGDKDKDLEAFLEGLYLYDYQFVKYFSDKEKKKNKLKSVKVKGISQKKIDELKKIGVK